MERKVGGMEIGAAFFVVRIGEEPQGFKKMASAFFVCLFVFGGAVRTHTFIKFILYGWHQL